MSRKRKTRTKPKPRGPKRAEQRAYALAKTENGRLIQKLLQQEKLDPRAYKDWVVLTPGRMVEWMGRRARAHPQVQAPRPHPGDDGRPLLASRVEPSRPSERAWCSAAMSVFDTGFKFNAEVPFLTEGEGVVFKRMRAKNQLTFYKIMACRSDDCDGEVPNSTDDEGDFIKPYCSRRCWANSEGRKHDDDGHDDDEEDW
jgi:hypothetical protein